MIAVLPECGKVVSGGQRPGALAAAGDPERVVFLESPRITRACPPPGECGVDNRINTRVIPVLVDEIPDPAGHLVPGQAIASPAVGVGLDVERFRECPSVATSHRSGARSSWPAWCRRTRSGVRSRTRRGSSRGSTA